MDREKDPMIRFRSTMRGKNSKGADRIQLYLSVEETQTLIDALTAALESPRGAKLDIHTAVKQAEGGRTFDSSFAFVRPVQDGPAAATPIAKTYKPKSTVKQIA